MAIIRLDGKKSVNLLAVRGLLGGALVVKHYKDKIVVAMPPRRKKRKPTPGQTDRRRVLKEAVIFARRIIADPAKKTA